MSERNGYVKLFRKIKSWEWYKDLSVKSLFFHLLLTVEPQDTYIQGIFIEAGSTKKTVNELSIECGLTTDQTRRAIKELQKTNEITIKTTNKYSVITLVKWLDYQDSELYKTKQKHKQKPKQNPNKNDVSTQTNSYTNTQTTSYIYKDIIIKDKDNTIQEEKKIRSVFEIYANGDSTLLTSLKDFETMRKENKKPMSDRAKQLLCTELDKLKADGQDLVACINQSIMRNYQGVFPINNNNFNKNSKPKERFILKEEYQPK